MRHRAVKPLLTYASLEEDPSCEHTVDRLVRLRVRGGAFERTIAHASHVIVQALGDRKRVWFRYERAADTLRARREAAYFDAGVELGTAACAVEGLVRARKKVRALADRVVRELLATGVTRDDAVAAAIMAAWGLAATAPIRRLGAAHVSARMSSTTRLPSSV